MNGISPRFLSILALVLLVQSLTRVTSVGGATISGRAYAANGMKLNGALVELFRDNGDAILDAADDGAVATTYVMPSGDYAFFNLEVGHPYFVVLPEQSWGQTNLPHKVSGQLFPRALDRVLDTFVESQLVYVNALAPEAGNIVAQSSGIILGGDRDVYLRLNHGATDAQVRVNPYGFSPVMFFEDSAGVAATAVINWDGVDASSGPVPTMGLGSFDLTNGGRNQGMVLQIGADLVGIADTLTLRIFESSENPWIPFVSEVRVELPVTGGTDSGIAFAPFDTFLGLATPTSVDAIQLVVDSGDPSLDIQFGYLAVGAPTLHDIVAVVPEPTECSWLAWIAACGLIMRSRRRGVL